MRRTTLIAVAGLLALVLGASACQQVALPATPGTPVGGFTATPPTLGTPLASPMPSPSATLQPTITPTAAPAATIGATLTLAGPTSGETIVSPVIVRGQGTIPETRAVNVQVLDAEGGVLGEGLIQFQAEGRPGQQGSFWGLLPYNAPRSGQPGRVVVVSPGGGEGQAQTRDEVAVTLRGTADQPLANLEIESPAAGAEVTGPLQIRGQGVVGANRVLPVQLVDANGNLLAQGTAEFPANVDVGQTATFTGTLQFTPPASDRQGFLLIEMRAAPGGQVQARDAAQVTIKATGQES
ncbi:MAG: Gmad2 immunoglobulin-like domain-containing protein [Anaerolineae bacterium]|nr:Gmad2 immunoglobulin-like domain-containing protein [Anaerolineae bacterium]